MRCPKPSQLFAALFASVLLVGCGETTNPGKKSPTVTVVDPEAQAKSKGIATSAKSGLPGVATPLPAKPSSAVTPLPRVDKMELESFPSAVNLDDLPGPDGVSLKLRLYNLDVPLAFALTQGEIEFVLYEGSIKEAEIGGAEPFYIWKFSSEQIAQSGRKTVVGWQYALSLNWLTTVPKTSVVTLVARIPRPDGGPIYARPVHLTMGPR